MAETRGKASDYGAFLHRTVGKVGYVIGTRGELCTQAVLDRAKKDYPLQSLKIDYAVKWKGMPVADCMGWEEMFENGGDVGKPVTAFRYPDRRTYADYDLAKALKLPNGPIATIPTDRPNVPIAVGYYGHVGYFYRGKVYQSAGHISGTIITELAQVATGLKAWEYWYFMPYLDYREETTTMLQKGSTGEPVRSLQAALLGLGYQLVDDAGKIYTTPTTTFASATFRAVNKFKADHSLPQDGVVDDATWGLLTTALRAQTAAQAEKTHAAEAMVSAQAEQLKVCTDSRAELEALKAKEAERRHALKVLAAEAEEPT